MHDVPSSLKEWSDFYVILGSASAALVGLTFIVITLVAADDSDTSVDGVSMFSSPTVAHFCSVLMAAAVVTAPWTSLGVPALLIAAVGIYGVVYIARITVAARRFDEYRVQAEDWIWYSAVPFVGYLTLVAAAVLLPSRPEGGLYTLAAGVLILIFCGIHNAWDVVTFLATKRKRDQEAEKTK